MTFLINPYVFQGSGLFAVNSYTGNGGSQNITTGQNLSGDGGLVWGKNTSDTFNHNLVDTVRGATKEINSDTFSAESTDTDGLTAFLSNGFTVGADSAWNKNSDGIATFSWPEQAEYFDIVTYTGNGTNRTINHNLSAEPELMLVKCRSNDESWAVYHSANTGSPETDYLLLDTSGRTVDDATYWNDTAPTSSVFSVGTALQTNNNTETYVAYLFAEKAGFSKMGSYTGDGTSSNAITGLGFEPNAVLTKRTDASGDWALHYNDGGTVYYITPNTTAVRGSALVSMDSDGFTLNSSSQNVNTGTYIYTAWK